MSKQAYHGCLGVVAATTWWRTAHVSDPLHRFVDVCDDARRHKADEAKRKSKELTHTPHNIICIINIINTETEGAK
jgi:hypothetical protein